MILWGITSVWAMDISGVVVDSNAEPVVSASVVVYDPRLHYEYVTTAEDGRFLFEDLPEGAYRLRVLPPINQNLLERWLPEGLSACEADPMTPVEDLVIELAEGNILSGQLIRSGEPLVGATITARTDDAPSLGGRTAVSDEQGNFQISGLYDDLPLGYWVELRGTTIGTQYLGGEYERSEAPTWLPESLGTFDVLPGISVSGTVFGPNGPPTQGTVLVSSNNFSRSVPIVDGEWAAIGLPPGEVAAVVRSPGLAYTWAPNTDRPAQTVSVLEEGMVVEDVDITAPTESILTARVTGFPPEVDPTEASVLVYNDDRTVAVSTDVQEDGSVTLPRLSKGAWSMYVFGVGAGLVSDWARDVVGNVRVFSVDGSIDVGEVPMPRGAMLSGTISDEQGNPVYGAQVVATNKSNGEQISQETARDGSYALLGLEAGGWALMVSYTAVCPGEPSFVTVYYEQIVNPLWAGGIVVLPGEQKKWNPKLPLDTDSDGMSDQWEQQHGLDPSVADSDGDPDDDGATNLQEYQLGTDPFVAELSPKDCGCSTRSSWPSFGIGAVACLVRRRKMILSSK